ncbi:glycoside hydrolase family 5 protein [Halomicrobium salinisoli]|uniref:glycoside hydrolase family 5 protein n=1 Tax=Halomicrobium salinisoli TaxID=2878391 RepID=UPI001CEFD72F|nr:cellulase family glycosylhydrolase [Halomicrobium salinisoli]
MTQDHTSDVTDAQATNRSTTTRRRLLKTTAAGALAAGIGTGAVGNAAARGKATPPLRRDGNRIVEPSGREVELHGINIADPKRVDVTAPARGKNAVQAIDLATDASEGWHANVVRLPVQPVDIGEHEPGSGPDPVAFTEAQLEAYLEAHLDPAIKKCKQEGAYAIVDYHRHRDIPWTDETLAEEVQLFWDVVAKRYANWPHVIFEVFNEPQGNPNYGASGQDLVDWWGEWLDTAQPWVDTIRSHADNLTLVGSPRWSQVTFGAVIEEFDGENLGYTLHLYPGHDPTTPADYDDWVTPVNYGGGDVPYDDETPAYEIAPVVMTEWGFDPDADPAAGGAVDEETANSVDWAEHDPDYGQHVTEWLSTRPVHSTAWVFDPIWDPNMFTRPFETESIGNPYDPDNEVPELCGDLPCEWELLTGDYMGDTVKEFLASENAGDHPGRGKGHQKGRGKGHQKGRGNGHGKHHTDE